MVFNLVCGAVLQHLSYRFESYRFEAFRLPIVVLNEVRAAKTGALIDVPLEIANGEYHKGKP